MDEHPHQPPAALPAEFDAVVRLIRLYWRTGERLSAGFAAGAGDDGTADRPENPTRRTPPEDAGYWAADPGRLRRSYDAYAGSPILAVLLRDVPWSHHLAVLDRCPGADERAFYLRTAARERWTLRRLERALDAGRFERGDRPPETPSGTTPAGPGRRPPSFPPGIE